MAPTGEPDAPSVGFDAPSLEKFSSLDGATDDTERITILPGQPGHPLIPQECPNQPLFSLQRPTFPLITEMINANTPHDCGRRSLSYNLCYSRYMHAFAQHRLHPTRSKE